MIQDKISGIKVFSATKAREREDLGNVITGWMKNNSDKRIIKTKVTQSSDEQFHCYSIALFWGEPAVTPQYRLEGVRIFSATKAKEREELGEVVTDWLRDNPEKRIIDTIITQSSDNQFHCYTITLLWGELL